MCQKMPTLGKKTIRFSGGLIIGILLILPIQLFGWGFTAHKQINNTAVFTLPLPLFSFYKKHIDEITDKAVNADMRRYIVPTEACRHYLDADHYEKKVPLDTIPQQWKMAILKYSEDTLRTYGIVPWNLIMIKYQLTKAFETKNLRMIIKLSADLGHYAGDLHVPLHSTENYNGQLTGQEGIHGLWESRVFELFQKDYDMLTGRAIYINDLHQTIWERFSQSYAALDSVLLFERLAGAAIPDRYQMVQKGNTITKVYNEKFCTYYHQLLHGMVERRFRASIDLVGSLWYTAWVDAGQPDLSQLKEEEIPVDEKNEDGILQTLWQKGQILGRKEEH